MASLGRDQGKQLKNMQFYRQKNIGDYIVDFYCPAVKLILEVDGGQPYEAKAREEEKEETSIFPGLALLC